MQSSARACPPPIKILAVSCLLLFAGGGAGISADIHSKHKPAVVAKDNHNQYTVTDRIVLGGDGRWDLVAYDVQGDRLFVPRSTRVMVIDPKKKTLIAEIPDTPGVHGVAFDYSTGKGFTSNGKDNSVTVFDLKSLKVKSKIKTTGDSPDAMVYDGFSKRLFVFNGHSSNATVIDPKLEKVIGTIQLSGKPELCASDEKGKIFVNLEDKGEVTSIDATKMTVLKSWPLSPGAEPSGLALDAESRRVFSACANDRMMVTDADTGKVITQVPTGEGADGAAFDPKTHLLFSPNGDEGTATIIHEDSPNKFSIVQTVATQKSARTIALNPKTHSLYLPAAQFEEDTTSASGSKHRPKVKPGTFTVLILGAQR